MPDWRELRVEGLGPIERVAAVFQISPPLERLPFVSFKVKVIERVNGTFLAVTMSHHEAPMANRITCPDWVIR